MSNLTDAQLIAAQNHLTGVIPADKIKWHTITFQAKRPGPKNSAVMDSCSIQVSSPVGNVLQAPDPVKGFFFVPVTWPQTWKFAREQDAFPLTRAVADRVHAYAADPTRNKAVGFVYFGGNGSHRDLHDFLPFNEFLAGKTVTINRVPVSGGIYVTNWGSQLVSGAHKLWVLSARDPANPNQANYGAYKKGLLDADELKRALGGTAGPYCPTGWNVLQPLQHGHDGKHWDYSQLLQLMKDLQGAKDENGKALTLREALLTGHPAVWDEEKLLNPKDLEDAAWAG